MGAQTFRCPGCGSTYDLPSILKEKGELRVRCPRCQRAYRLRWQAAGGPPVAPPAKPAGPAAGSAPSAPSSAQELRRARRFARALAEGMLQAPGRRERRDRALAEGRLLEEFGAEVAAAWRLYVDKVGEEMARTSPYFRDAFNAILADGRPLF